MAACDSDFLVADNFDAAMAVIDADMLEKDAEMLSELYSVIKTYHQQRNLDTITVIFAPKFAYQIEGCRDM